MSRKVLLFLFTLSLSFIFASTGKIAGVATDKDTDEPLIGVNVYLENTSYGSATDEDGYFVILNLTPGTYTLKASYISYAEYTLNGVKVVADVTRKIDIALTPTAISAEEVIVAADRVVYERGATNTVRVLDEDDLAKLPIATPEKAVALNAGVVSLEGSGGETGNAQVFVRGGRSNETLYVVDGVPINDLFFGGSAGQIPTNAIEQISTQFGGFSARYGNAQSGVINITTRSSTDRMRLSAEGQTSSLTDAYNYNLISGSIATPLYIVDDLGLLVSVEYNQTDDGNPRIRNLEIPTAGIDKEVLPETGADIFKYVAKLDWDINDDFKLGFSASGSMRNDRLYVHLYAKDNAKHNPDIAEDTYNTVLRGSYVLSENSFFNVNLRYRYSTYERGDGVFGKNFEAYGNPNLNSEYGAWVLERMNNPSDPVEYATYFGGSIGADPNGVFFSSGRVNNLYQKYLTENYGGDFDFVWQLDKHYIEIGGTAEMDVVRYFDIRPRAVADVNAVKTIDEYAGAESAVAAIGYDYFGNSIDSEKTFTLTGGKVVYAFAPPKPVTMGFYINDRIEFDDFILSAGLRFEFFDPGSFRVKDKNNPLGDDRTLQKSDFEDMPTEAYVSPRLGFSFPITERTSFHAQYGIFRQKPRYIDLYTFYGDLRNLENDEKFTANNGHLQYETTTQYEFGFMQTFGPNASLDVTAYYKNIDGLTNVQRFFQSNFQSNALEYYSPTNEDFGTVKGLALSAAIRNIGPFSAKMDYTLELGEGTGSSQSSSFTAVFRNDDSESPKAIAPLDFNQVHTFITNLSISYGQDNAPFDFLSNSSGNFIVSFNSGRPYTPVEQQDILQGATLIGQNVGYINNARMPANFRIDMKVDKTFYIDNISLTGYVVVQNLLASENIIDVYRSTGEGDNTNYLISDLGREAARNDANFASDYKAFEKDPFNYGIPRLIRLGLRVGL
jgi:outer membrane receptor protein involved in Fe transport